MLGPPDGRYVVRGAAAGREPEHVLVLGTLGAPQRHRLRRGHTRPAAGSPDPRPVSTTRATVIEAVPSPDTEHAQAWLRSLNGEDATTAALTVLNRALHAQRVASAAPAVHEVAAGQALVVRAGFGEGEQVADGHWSEARELRAPAPGARRGRSGAALRPQERFAALLGGHDRPLACEELALRARSDLDAGRMREALLSLDGALRAATVELREDPGRARLDERVGELQDLRTGVAGACERALANSFDQGDVAVAGNALERLEAALRARSAAGVGPEI